MASRRAPDFTKILARVSRALRERDIPFMVIGGQAVLLYGEPRLTQDIGVTLGLAPDQLPDILAVCDAAGMMPLPENVGPFVEETFVLPVDDEESGVRIDFIFSTTPYEAGAIERSVHVDLEGERVPFASAKDLLLHKLFAGRPRDKEDARGVVRRKGDELDWDYLRHWAVQFSKIPGREQLPEEVEELRRREEP